MRLLRCSSLVSKTVRLILVFIHRNKFSKLFNLPMTSRRIRHISIELCLLVLLSYWTEAACAQPVLGTPEQELTSDTHTISPGVKEIVEELEIEPLLNQLLAMPDKNSLNDREKLERVTLKQDITNEILQTVFEIHGTDARINYEIAQMSEIRAYFEERRDRAVKLNSIANIVSGALVAGIGNSLDLIPKTDASNAGDIVEMSGGAFQTGLAGLALKQQSGEAKMVNSTPNMLAKFLVETLMIRRICLQQSGSI